MNDSHRKPAEFHEVAAHALSRKPGALAGSRPLEQQCQAGLWPESFDVIWQSLMQRHGKQGGTKQMIDLLKLAKQNGRGRLQNAIETALATGCTDAAAVQHLFHARDLNRGPCEAIDIGSLERYQRPMPVVHQYDQLLMAGRRAQMLHQFANKSPPAITVMTTGAPISRGGTQRAVERLSGCRAHKTERGPPDRAAPSPFGTKRTRYQSTTL